MTPAKPCKLCESIFHYPFQCRLYVKRPRQVITQRKLRPKTWGMVRRRWFRDHKADNYSCYICEAYLPKNETSLDHVIPRGSHPELKYELTNLEPACGLCQIGKGSRSLENYLAERDRLGLPVSEYARQRAEKIT